MHQRDGSEHVLEALSSVLGDIPFRLNLAVQNLSVLSLHSTPPWTRKVPEQFRQVVVLSVRHARIVHSVLEKHFDDVQASDLLTYKKAHLTWVICVVRELRLEVCE